MKINHLTTIIRLLFTFLFIESNYFITLDSHDYEVFGYYKIVFECLKFRIIGYSYSQVKPKTTAENY
jgi:hypothetical protein